MSTSAGSPKGNAHLWPCNVTQEEVDSKGGLKNRLQDDLDALAEGALIISSEKINLHPFVSEVSTNIIPYLWTVYPTVLTGEFLITVQGSILEDRKPVWKYWGSGYDFIHKLIHQIPETTKIFIPGKSINEDAMIDMIEEGRKIGIRVTVEDCKKEKSVVENNVLPSKFPDTEGYGVEDLKEDASDPSTYFKLTDPGHQGFQVSLGSRLDRIIRIALHVIQTPQDENPNRDQAKNWSVVPDKPSSQDEQEGIEYFSTRDKAVSWMHEQEEDKKIVANALGEWLEPEEAALIAWEMRG